MSRATSGRSGKSSSIFFPKQTSSRRKAAISRSRRKRRTGPLRCRSPTPESGSRPRIMTQCSRSFGRSERRTRKSKAPGSGWLCRESSSNCTGAKSGSRARSERVRRSRSRCRCGAANELIMIVEDNPKNLKLVRDVLQIRGYRTIEAGTGEEAVQMARGQHPALVLMDIQLPGISGVEAFHQLRADPATEAIPVIAVTASVMAQERQKVIAAGFDGFQGKPISVRELLETVRQILDKSAQ